MYYQSRNIASFDLPSFLEVLKFVKSSSPTTSYSVREALKNRVHERDVSGYLSLGWHTGLLGYYVDRGRGYYTITHLGARVLSSCINRGPDACIEELKSVFSSWTPYIVFSEFARIHGFGRKGVVKALGSEMLYWTGLMLKIGLPVKTQGRPVKKPFNDYVVAKFFKPLVDTVGLVTSRRGKPVYWSRRGEPIAAVGVASTVVDSSGGRVFMVSYVTDGEGLNLVFRSIEVAPRKSGHLTIVVYKPVFNIDHAKTVVTNLKNKYPVDIEVYRVKTSTPVHAKLYANEKTVLVSSANLTSTSLFRNVEFTIQLENTNMLEEAEAKITAVADRVM